METDAEITTQGRKGAEAKRSPSSPSSAAWKVCAILVAASAAQVHRRPTVVELPFLSRNHAIETGANRENRGQARRGVVFRKTVRRSRFSDSTARCEMADS